MLIKDDIDIEVDLLEEAQEISEISDFVEVMPDDPELLKRKHYFINECVEDLLRRYIWTNCTDVILRDAIMGYAPELIKQIIRKQNLHMIYPGQEESAFGDLVQTAWCQLERTLYKFRAKPHCRVCYNPDRPISSALYIPSELEYGIITFDELFSPKHKPSPGSRKLIKGHKCPHCKAELSDHPDVEPKQGTFGGSRTVLFRGNSKVFNMWCLTPDSLVFSDQGVISLGSIVHGEGSAVYGSENLTKVVATLDREEVDTIRLKSRLGYTVEGSPDHGLKILETEPHWATLSSLHEGDLVGIQFNQQFFLNDNSLCDIILSKKGEWNPPWFIDPGGIRRPAITEELANIIGLFIAEGSYSYGKLVIYNEDLEVIDRLVNNHLGLRFIHEPKYQRISLCNVRFIEFLIKLGFGEHTSAETKFIPSRLLRCSKSILRAMLSGMFDGDGHSSRYHGPIGYTSSSGRLISQLRMLLLNFGIITKIQKDKRKKRHFKRCRSGSCDRISSLVGAWQLTASTYFSKRFYDEIGFGIAYKQAKRRHLTVSRELIFGLNVAFRSLYAKFGCGTFGYDSVRRVLKASSCTLDMARRKLASWSEHASDIDYRFVEARIDEFTRSHNNIIWLPIVSLERSRSPVCEITVAHPDHTYIANGFISKNSQVSRTVILAFVKKEGRDRKNAGAYRDHLCDTNRVDEDRLKRFFSEANQLCKHNIDHIKCIEALCYVIKHDDKPYDGLIGKLVERSKLTRMQVNSFIKLLRLRSHEFTDSPLSKESDRDKQSKKQFLYQDEE